MRHCPARDEQVTDTPAGRLCVYLSLDFRSGRKLRIAPLLQEVLFQGIGLGLIAHQRDGGCPSKTFQEGTTIDIHCVTPTRGSAIRHLTGLF